MMFEQSIREGKLPPDYTGTDEHHVRLTLEGDVRDPQFLAFLERISHETQESFSTDDVVLLDSIHREQPIPEPLTKRIPRLRDLGVIESHGRGKGTRRVLSRRFYTFVGQTGQYTSRVGLDHETNKQLLLKHIQDNSDRGSQLAELIQVVPHIPRATVRDLLQELRHEQSIVAKGTGRGARWYPEKP